jgi:hypothetical protein
MITNSKFQTKLWRQSQIWYRNGKHTECEIYQLNYLKLITKLRIEKTYDRIHKIKKCIVSEKQPFRKIDGFEYSENFDGKSIWNNKCVYFNLKFVCDKGGAQTRTLKQVYV